MRITVKYPKEKTTPFIWKVDVCCRTAAKHLFHPVVNELEIDVPVESKMRIFAPQKKVTMNQILVNFCPFCGEEVIFSDIYEFSAGV